MSEIVPTFRQRQILAEMRQGRRLAQGTSKFKVAFLDESEEVDLRTVEAMLEAGWIYQLDDLNGKAVWGLTREGLELLSG